MLTGTRTPDAREAAAKAHMDRPDAARFVSVVTAVVITSWLPVLLGATTRAAFGWGLAAVAALAIAWLTRRDRPAVLITGFVLSSAFVPSGLVTDATHYMPVAVTGAALALRIGVDAPRLGLRQLPPTAVMIAIGLYLAWAAVTTLTSIDRRVSAVYLVGMIAVCGFAFWVFPIVLSRQEDRDRLLASLGAAGVAVAVSVYLVSVLGGPTVFGRLIGFYRVVDLTVMGRPTGLHFGYSSGVFLTPLEPSVLMVIGIVALLGWSARRSNRDLRVAAVSSIFITPAVLLTLDRSAWLAAVVGAGTFMVLAYFARVRAAPAAWVFVFFTACFLVVLVNLAGANSVGGAGVCTTACSAGGDETPIRGGTGLSGREYLWTASTDAIKARPIVGYGAGNDVQAIDPYVSRMKTPGYNLMGLTSHSTWFRTAVEMGVPGLLLLIAALLAAALMFLRLGFGAGARPDPTRIAAAAMVCALLPAMTFETFLFGGVTFSSLVLTVAAGLAAGAVSSARTSGEAPPPEGRWRGASGLAASGPGGL